VSSFYGADVEQLRALAQEILHRSGEISAATARLSSRIDDVSWSGPDGQRFKARWATELAVDLKRVAMRMEEAAQAALSNAREQEEKSGGVATSRPAPQPSTQPLPGIMRDMEYREGRDYFTIDGKSVPVIDDPADGSPPYIEVDGRRISRGDPDWPPQPTERRRSVPVRDQT